MIVKMTNDQMTDSPRTIWTMDHMPGGGHHVTANWHTVAEAHSAAPSMRIMAAGRRSSKASPWSS